MASSRTGRDLAEEVSLMKERKGWNSWLTEPTNDGRLQVDLLTTKPKSAPLMSADRAQLIQVTANAKVQEGKVEKFINHHPDIDPALGINDEKSIQVDSILAYSGKLAIETVDFPDFLEFEYCSGKTETTQTNNSEKKDNEQPKSTIQIPEIPADIVDALFLGDIYSFEGNPFHLTAGDRINLPDSFAGCRIRLIHPKTNEVVKVMKTDSGGDINTSQERISPDKVRLEIEELPEHLNQPNTETQR